MNSRLSHKQQNNSNMLLFDQLLHCLSLSHICQGPIGAAAIRRSIQGMLEELEYNLWEAILVRLVDYGHTVSPELEMAALR